MKQTDSIWLVSITLDLDLDHGMIAEEGIAEWVSGYLSYNWAGNHVQDWRYLANSNDSYPPALYYDHWAVVNVAVLSCDREGLPPRTLVEALRRDRLVLDARYFGPLSSYEFDPETYKTDEAFE